MSLSASTILPGEPLDLAFRLQNASGSDISIKRPNEKIGSVGLQIARKIEPITFREYLGPGWGTEDSIQTPKALTKNAAIDLPLRVLYQVQRQDPYTLPAAGTFILKVTYQDGSVCPEGTATPIVTVEVVDPKGVDLIVWNAIKDCRNCAHFLHTGTVGRTQADLDALALLRRLVKEYPKSHYARNIRKQLDALDDKSRGSDKNGKSHNDKGVHDDP